MALRICLRDLKKAKYSKSFDKILAKAKEASANQEEQVQFLTGEVLMNILFPKQGEKCKKSDIRTNMSSQISQMCPKISRCKLDKSEASKSETSGDQDDEMILIEENMELEGLVTSSPPKVLSLKLKKSREVMTCNEDSPSSSGHQDDQTKRKRKSSDDQDKYDEYRTNKRKEMISLPYDIPEMPLDLKNKVEALKAFQIEFVIQKRITSCDLRKNQNRLSFPQSQVRADAQDFRKELHKQLEEFLKKKQLEEYAKDHQTKEIKPEGIMCKLIEPCLKVNDLRLMKWDFTSSSSYVLNGGWDRTFQNKENGLTENDLIQVWSFRVRDNEEDSEDQGKLWFALVNKGQDNANTSSSGTNSSNDESFRSWNQSD